MATPFTPKLQYARVIAQALAEMGETIDAESAVTLTGTYGEKGMVVFPQDPDADGHGTPVGAFLFGKDVPNKHINIGRNAAVALVGLLIEEFGLEIEYVQVPVTVMTERVLVR